VHQDGHLAEILYNGNVVKVSGLQLHYSYQ